MSKPIKSASLYKYLQEQGVLGLGEDKIKEAKREYLKIYKREWKKTRGKKQKEYRPTFTSSQVKMIHELAKSAHMTPTAFIKQSALASAGLGSLIPRKDILLFVLQKISMVTVQMINTDAPEKRELENILQTLTEAETMLLSYLKQ